jgi:hypothetical protein
MLENLTWQHYLGAALFLVAVIGLLWVGYQQGSRADAREKALHRAAEKAWRDRVNAMEARRAKLRQAEQRGIAS